MLKIVKLLLWQWMSTVYQEASQQCLRITLVHISEGRGFGEKLKGGKISEVSDAEWRRTQILTVVFSHTVKHSSFLLSKYVLMGEMMG